MEITKEECQEAFDTAIYKLDEKVEHGVIDPESDEFFDFVATFFFTAGIVYVATKYGIKTPVTDAPDVHH